MWKKLLIGVLALVGMSAMMLNTDNIVDANTEKVTAGGTLTGRIGPAGGGDFKKGDRIITGIKNPIDDSDMSWQILAKESYTEYNCSSYTSCNNPEITGYYSLAEKSIGNTDYGLEIEDFTIISINEHYKLGDSTKSKVYENYILPLNEQLSEQDRLLITYRNLIKIRKQLKDMSIPEKGYESFMKDIGLLNNVYVPFYTNILPPEGAGQVTYNDYKFDNQYWGQFNAHDDDWTGYDNFFINTDGTPGSGYSPSAPKYTAITPTLKKDVRPAVTLKLDDVVFAVSNSDLSGWGNIEAPSLSASYTDIRQATGEPMKVRIKDTTLSETTKYGGLINQEGQLVEVLEPGTQMQIIADAKAGTTADGVNTVSILIFNEQGEFQYYKPLEAAKGIGAYVLDLTDLPEGNYTFGIVNEVYNEDSNAPALTSDIKKVKEDILHELSWEGLTKYTYNENVKVGDVVGTINRSSGIVPITYELQANGNNDYEYFEFVGLENGGTSSEEAIQVKIKDDASGDKVVNGSLIAGDYTFCVNSHDAIGLPNEPDATSRICPTIHVEKADPKLEWVDGENHFVEINSASIDEPYTHEALEGSFTYESSDPEVATIDEKSEKIAVITPKAKAGTTTVKVKFAETENYNSAEISKIVTTYEPLDISWIQFSPYPIVEDSEANTQVGSLMVSGGVQEDPEIGIKAEEDGVYFQIDMTGSVSLKQEIPVTALENHTFNEEKQAYEMTVTFTISQNDQTIEREEVIYIQGKNRVLSFADVNENNQIVKQYSENGTFQLRLTETVKNVTYQIQEDSPTDVIGIQNAKTGITTILHANETSVEGYQAEQVYVEAIVPASDGYMGTTVQAEVLIQRAKQTLSFAKNPINTTSDVSKLNVRVNGHKDSKDLLYETKDQSISISADPSDTDQAVIETHGVVKDGIELRVKAQGDRDYLPTDETSEGKATLNIRKPGEKPFKAVFPDMTYGDTGPFKVVMEPAANADITYEYDVQPKGIIDIDEDGNITIHNAGSVSVDIIQHTKDGEIGPYSYDLTVKPRELVIEIDDKTMQVGTAVPEFTYQITSGNIVAGDDLGDFIFDCKDTEGRPVDEQSEAGSYDITGNYQNQNGNYNITVHKGTLTITQDHIDNSWMHLETADGQRYNSIWTNQNVYLVSDSVVYQDISLNKQTWANRVEVNAEGNHTYDFWMKSTSGAITSKGVTSAIKIDKTAPVINDIRVLQATRNAYENFMNTISFGMLYGNQKTIQVQATDPTLGGVNEVSNIAEITYTLQKLDANLLPEGNPTTGKLSGSDREISVSGSGMHEVCAIAYDHAGNASSEHCEQVDLGMDESIDSNQNGCQDLNIEMPDGSILNEDVNRDGIPELNIDTDMDGKADINIDSDGDRKPDINVVAITKWEPNSTCSIVDGVQYETMLNLKPVINIDVDGDNIPDLDIDNDGDLKGDLNISKDGKTPSINITTIHTWNPHTDYTHAGFTYDSIGTKADDPKPELNIDSDDDGRPDINVDIDGDGKEDINIDMDDDGIPDIDIDSDGDGIPDVNVDVDEDGEADENIVDIPEWKPEMNVDGDLPYDTMPNLKPEEEDQLEDNGIIVEDPDGTFTSNYQLKVEIVTDTISNVVKEAIGKHVDIDQEIKEVYDVILLKDNVRVQPDGTLKIKIPVDESILNPNILIEQKDGTFKEIEVVIENGYYVFETDYLGKVSILGDRIEDTLKNEEVNNHAVGGADTGDMTHIDMLVWMLALSIMAILSLTNVTRKKTM